MSTSITSVTPAIAEYLSTHFNAEDAFLARLREEALENDIPPINISGEQGAFLQLYLRASGARCVIEVGSLAGYSAIIMARALPADGEVHCIEINSEYCDFIRRKAHQAGLQNVIHVHSGAGLDILRSLQLNRPADFVFIDADKPNYWNYLNASYNLLRTGGVICADNTLAWGEIANPSTEFEPHNVRALQEYNHSVVEDIRFQSCLVPLGDGMTMALKL